MFGKYAIRISIMLASLVLGPLALADEVVQFTNGAEMTVQSHVVIKDMVKLDLGGNNSISFPVSMVSKIVSAGKDVFRNPVYYPTNQAIAGVATAGTPAFATSATGPGGARVRQAVPGQAGMRLGEAGDRYDPNDNYGSGAVTTRSNPHDDTSVVGKSKLDPRRPLPPGGVATIDPPGAHWPVGKVAPQMSPRGVAPPPASPPSTSESPSHSGQEGNAGQAQEEPPPSDDAGNEPPPPPDPPPSQP